MKTVIVLTIFFTFTLFAMHNELCQEQTYIDAKGNEYIMLVLGPDLGDEEIEWKPFKKPLRRCTRNGFGQVLLNEGCKLGKLCLVKRAIEEEQAPINVKDTSCRYQTPLHVAADEGHKDIVEYLLSLDPAIDARDDEGYTPLHVAVYQDHASITERLCDAGADINIKNNDGDTALHIALQEYAASSDSKKIINILLSYRAKLSSIKNKEGKTAFECATKQAKLFLKWRKKIKEIN